MTMVIKAFFVFTLHLFHVAQSSESDEARKLISIHDLTSGEELNPQRLRFQKIRSEETVRLSLSLLYSFTIQIINTYIEYTT